MRIIPFPGSSDARPDEAWLAELEAALNGDAAGPAADSWRELRADVRALAPSMDPEFERRLAERIESRASRPLRGSGSEASQPRSDAPGRRPGRWGRLRPPGRLGAVGVVGTAVVAAAIAALVISGPSRTSTSRQAIPDAGPRPAVATSQGAVAPRAANQAVKAFPAAAPVGPVPSAPVSAPGRVQQLAASLTLAATPNDVQEVADRVGRLVVSDEGFVQSSHVQVQQQGPSEATLMLKLPSAKLSAALASLGQLAPVRAESQSLQDITDAYDAARQRLADATAERRALLRALASATTQGQIDSLRERLSLARGAIARARSGLEAVSRRGSTAEVEVTVAGDAHASSNGLTLQRGLHDAGRVLLVTLVVLLVGAAIVVPLTLLVVALTIGLRAWRRYTRERILDAS
jgi:Domain of unknown function (DUF4349)